MSLTFAFFLETALKSTALLAVAFVVALLLRRKSAALRHQVWIAALASILVLPFFSSTLPNLQVPLAQSALTNTWLFQAQTPATLHSPLPNPQYWLLALWAFGVALSFTQIFMGWRTVERIRRHAQPIVSPEIDGEIDLRQTDAGTMPITYGLLRPVILLPSDANEWTAERRRVVLLHELAHVRRKDPATHLLARIALAFYWWHPLVWNAWRESLKERERAADDMVLNAGAAAPDYASHLLAIARSLQPPSAVALAMARPSQLQGRLAAILDSTRNRAVLRRTSLLITSLAALAIVVTIAVVHAKTIAPEHANPYVYQIGGDVLPPKLVSKVEPEYSEVARAAKYSGSLLLDIEVGIDGSTRNIKVIRPLGFGLDEKAVEAVRKWRFAPATRDGQPVAVTAHVEVTFRLQ